MEYILAGVSLPHMLPHLYSWKHWHTLLGLGNTIWKEEEGVVAAQVCPCSWGQTSFSDLSVIVVLSDRQFKPSHIQTRTEHGSVRHEVIHSILNRTVIFCHVFTAVSFRLRANLKPLSISCRVIENKRINNNFKGTKWKELCNGKKKKVVVFLPFASFFLSGRELCYICCVV